MMRYAKTSKEPSEYVARDSVYPVLWAGVVEEITEIDLTMTSTTVRRLAYRCLSFDSIATHRVIAESYTSQTLNEIVTDIITDILAGDGISAGVISTGPVFPRVVFPYMYVSQALDELTQRAGFFSAHRQGEAAARDRARSVRRAVEYHRIEQAVPLDLCQAQSALDTETLSMCAAASRSKLVSWRSKLATATRSPSCSRTKSRP